MPTTYERVCCTEIGQLWQKVEEHGPETQKVVSLSVQVFGQFASMSGCWRRPITHTGSSKSHRKRVSYMFSVSSVLSHSEIDLLELFLPLI